MHASRELAFAAVLLGMFMAQLDTSVVVAALPTMDAELRAGPAIAGVTSAYLAAVTVATLAHGRLGDRYGRRAAFTVSVVVFALGSAACGLAPGIGVLVAARALQGLGGGGLIVHAMAVLGELFDKTELIRRAGWQTATFAVSSLAGPPVGGLLAAGPGWRWIFLLNLPLCGLALALGLPGLPRTRAVRVPRAPDRGVRRSVVVTALSGAAIFGTFSYVALVVALAEPDPARTGLVLTAMTAGQLLVSVSFAVLARRWPRMVVWGRLGCASGAAGLALLALTPRLHPALIPGLVLVGAAFGLCASAYTLLAQAKAANMGATMAALTFARQAGGVAGTVAFGGLAVLVAGSLGPTGLTTVFAAAALIMLLALGVSPGAADEPVTKSMPVPSPE